LSSSSTARTQVCITIDTEFSIAGAFENPADCRPAGEQVVRCVEGSREHGLGFILDNLAQSGIRATFFVEALQTAYFGDAPMGGIVETIVSAGQDVQLHVHPCWLRFRDPDWHRHVKDVNDACSGRTDADLDEILSAGLDTFSRWGLNRPIAVRTGNLEIDVAAYAALKRWSIPISSSVNPAISPPHEQQLKLWSGRHWIGGVLELPVLTFRAIGVGRWGRLRALTVTACSWSEITNLLWHARRAGVSPVVILTHPTEFIKSRDMSYRRIRQNRVNQSRFVRLLGFLKEHAEDFEAISMSDGAAGWINQGAAPNALLPGTNVGALGRMVENFVSDHVWSY
jgi:hypothetical protein